MRGMYGLGLAIALGAAGALLNFTYLNSKSRDEAKVQFIGIKPDVALAAGETLQAEHMEPVGIPSRFQGNLPDFAVLYAARETVIGRSVWRAMAGPTLLLADDLNPPPLKEVKLEANERAWGIHIDSRQFVFSLLNPGDWVSFLVPRTRVGLPTPAVPEEPADGSAPPAPRPSGPVEQIGKFKVLSVGNRLGSSDAMRAAKVPVVQENVLMIALKVDENGELDENAKRLVSLVNTTDFRGVGIILHPRKTSGK